MIRKVAVEGNLHNIKKRLSDLGYEIVDINENTNAEAIVYMGDGYSIPYQNQMVSMTEGLDMTNNKGAILINAAGKSVEEIDYIINNRMYSPLFD